MTAEAHETLARYMPAMRIAAAPDDAPSRTDSEAPCRPKAMRMRTLRGTGRANAARGAGAVIVRLRVVNLSQIELVDGPKSVAPTAEDILQAAGPALAKLAADLDAGQPVSETAKAAMAELQAAQ